MEEKVLQTIQKYKQIESGDKIVVGVSGGPDSICLLFLLNKLKEKLNINLYVAHINHMIRKNAILDEQYVIDFCKNLNIPCYIKKEQVEQIAKNRKCRHRRSRKMGKVLFF